MAQGKSDLALGNTDRAPVSLIAADRGVEVAEPQRHPDWQTFPHNLIQTCKDLRQPAGQFGKSMVLCAHAALTIEKLAEQRSELDRAAGLAITALAFEQERAHNQGDAVAFAQITAAKDALIAAQNKVRGRDLAEMKDITPKGDGT